MLNEDTDTLSQTFAALADPTRRSILARLSQGGTTVSELAEPFEMSMPAISRHLKVLEAAGMITREVDAQWRVCHLRAAPLQEANSWIERYRRFWESRFDALAEYLEEAVTKEVRG